MAIEDGIVGFLFLPETYLRKKNLLVFKQNIDVQKECCWKVNNAPGERVENGN